MPRPLPVNPRGPRRRARPKRDRLLFACPRVAPDWELRALQNLMKPKPFRREALAHRSDRQEWPAGADAAALELHRLVSDRLADPLPELHLHAPGEYHLVMDFPPPRAHEILAYALALSRRLPEIWFTFDRLFIRDRTPYGRKFGHGLDLVVAANVHLPRYLRSTLRDLL